LFGFLNFFNIDLKFKAEIRMFISEDVQKKLDERILQESIGMASIDKLERSFFVYSLFKIFCVFHLG